MTGNTFNAANEMTAFNGTPQTYDANGNLTNDGTSTYNWDARNHLTAIAGPNAASFAYDSDGRRAQKTINSTSTQFLYDGLNPVQEIQSGAPSANLLTGLGVDEYFQRTDSAGARNYMTDILGSTLALTDSSGSTQTSYTYDPFGNTTLTGASSSNPYRFTGRETDGTGLYNFRARYYSPTLQRFISQDPLGFAGGDIDLYAYGSNNPVSLTDQLGLDAYLCDRPLKGFSGEHWRLYHQYICVVLDDATYCFGLYTYNGQLDTPESLTLNVPGGFEGDKPNKSCTKESSKKCVDSCLLGVAEGTPPDYSVVNLFGMNCQEFATSAIANCQAKCAHSSD